MNFIQKIKSLEQSMFYVYFKLNDSISCKIGVSLTIITLSTNVSLSAYSCLPIRFTLGIILFVLINNRESSCIHPMQLKKMSTNRKYYFKYILV